jgi:hypothetical protein
MKVKNVEVADPGSTDAVAEGCTCPVMDNRYGEGVPGYPEGTFWINEGCPIHSEAYPFDPDGIGGNELLIAP